MIWSVVTRTVISHIKRVTLIHFQYSVLATLLSCFVQHCIISFWLLLDNVIQVLASNAFSPHYPSAAFICRTTGSRLLANTWTDKRN